MLSWLPRNISSFGRDVDALMYLIYYVVGAWLILAEGVLLYFLWRYRRRAHPRAVYQPGTSRGAMAWVIVPCVAVMVCDFAIDLRGAPVWEHIKQEVPPYDVLVRIEGRQFAWNFRHAGKDGLLDTADDIVTNGQLHVPVGKVVKFELISKDVVHSFWVPSLRLKQDAVPGRKIIGWFDTTTTGSFPIACAQLCGTGHGIMQATLIVQDQADYDRWLEANK